MNTFKHKKHMPLEPHPPSPHAETSFYTAVSYT